MNNPEILKSIYVKRVNINEFGVFTSTGISANSTIEYCAWLPITKQIEILILKNDSQLASNLFQNPDGMTKELEITHKIAELDLQTRLDKGLITSDQFKAILLNTINPSNFLNIISNAILLGYGSLYRKSITPNINYEYDTDSKLYRFYTVNDVYVNQELTYFAN